MNTKLLIKSIVAFGLALALGRVVFTSPPLRGEQKAASSANADGAGAMQVASPAKKDTFHVPPRNFVASTANRDFKPVNGGMLNENGRMDTFVSALYQEGIVHTAPRQFNAQVAWKPYSQEVRNGGELVALEGLPKPSKAYVLNRDGLKQVIYPSTYANTEDRLMMRADGGMEHDIVLKNAPVMTHTAELAFTGYLQLSDDLSMWDGQTEFVRGGTYTTRHGIHFKNSSNNTVFYLRPPCAYDASVAKEGGGLDEQKQALPEYQSHLTACEYQISFDERGVKLAVVTRGAWLMNPERSYPVVIDPNFGPFGLADGDPPIYTGSVGSDTFIPLHNGANGQGSTKLAVGNACTVLGFPETNWGQIAMPFAFSYYAGQGGNPAVFPIGTPLFVHEVGFASWIMPDPDPFPLLPFAPCFDVNAQPPAGTALPSPGYPNNAMYPYWEDLHFSPDPLSAIYYLFDNTGGPQNGRLIIEWYKMGYFFGGGNAGDVISFNLILYECNSIVEFIIKNPGQGEKDRGGASIGIEDPTGTIGIQYCFDPIAQGLPEIPDSTAITFTVSPLSNIAVKTTTPRTGCIPLTVCYQATITITAPPCTLNGGGGTSIPPSFGYHWDFGDGGQAFTPNVCHTFVTPGNYAVKLTVTDGNGNQADIINGLAVEVCDIPPVIITATPQGGTAPLSVDITAKATSPVININGVPTQTIPGLSATGATIVVDQQDPQGAPFTFTPFTTIAGATGTVLFTNPGTYRVQANFTGTSFGLPTTGTGTIFIDVIDPNSPIANSLIITQSSYTINWAGKLPNQLGVPTAPASDTISVQGIVNLEGMSLSSLAGQQVTIALNGYNPIFQGTLNASGTAIQGDFATGITGTFKIDATGHFSMNVTGDYAFSLGLTSLTEHRLLTAHYKISLGSVFTSPGTTVVYDYKSTANKTGKGFYQFGNFAKYGTIPGAPGGFGQPGGQEVLLSGGFI